MFLNLGDDYIKTMKEPFMQLPKQWDGRDLSSTVNEIYTLYLSSIKPMLGSTDYINIQRVCRKIVRALKNYYWGYPSRAFRNLKEVMDIVFDRPVKVYQKSGMWTQPFDTYDPLKLYRIRNVLVEKSYSRDEIFHIPYNNRSKVPSCRFSIAGFPSLYLSTCLELAREEVKPQEKEYTISSRYELIRDILENRNHDIKVIEFAIKPYDFVKDSENRNTNFQDGTIGDNNRVLNGVNLNSSEVRLNYLYWYPLILACSIIRINRNDPFAPEYIVPQMLMQWVHMKSKENQLYGIRYFSCASEIASEMGFNYVFPVNGKRNHDEKLCKILSNSFLLTKPIIIKEDQTLDFWRQELLKRDNSLDYVYK